MSLEHLAKKGLKIDRNGSKGTGPSGQIRNNLSFKMNNDSNG